MIGILSLLFLTAFLLESPSNLHRVLDVGVMEVIEPKGDTISAGEEMKLIAKFRNLGVVDAETIPITCRIYNAGPETPQDSLLYLSNHRIPLYWRGSEKDSIIESVVDFGSFEVPETTIPGNWSGRYMGIEFRLAEIWMDDDPFNDYRTVYVNGT